MRRFMPLSQNDDMPKLPGLSEGVGGDLFLDKVLDAQFPSQNLQALTFYSLCLLLPFLTHINVCRNE